MPHPGHTTPTTFCHIWRARFFGSFGRMVADADGRFDGKVSGVSAPTMNLRPPARPTLHSGSQFSSAIKRRMSPVSAAEIHQELPAGLGR